MRARACFTMPSSRPVALLVAGLGLALLVTGMPVQDSAAAAPMPTALGPVTASQGEVRPDSVSAMVTARTSGVRVEDVSQRTKTTNIFANPDGTWTSETATEPVQVQETDGVWHDVDTTLTATGGGLVPRYAATDLVPSNGGDKTFATVTTDGGKELDWRWPTKVGYRVRLRD